MSLAADIAARHERCARYLDEVLLPFWIDRAPDPEYGGFLSHFDARGEPTGETEKTLLMQLRLLFTFARAARAGRHRQRCLQLAHDAARFVRAHYHDAEHGGWFWSAARDGTPIDERKIGYGQCFALYAFAEYARATGDAEARETMLLAHRDLQRMADPEHGGYFELMLRDWRRLPGGLAGGDRKSFDVHMHAMEALTALVEVTDDDGHRRELAAVRDLLIEKMLDPQHGTGRMQFALDWTPLRAIRFGGVAWGRDADPDEDAFPLPTTSWGHNVEFAWLLLEAADALGESRERDREVVTRLCDNCLEFGLDHEQGGVYVDGLPDRIPGCRDKQFWQQAETMVGMVAAFQLTGDVRYWHAFANVQDFVWTKMIAWDGGGEWYGRCLRDGTPTDTALGTHYKISYHTVRAMVEVVERLAPFRDSCNAATGLP